VPAGRETGVDIDQIAIEFLPSPLPAIFQNPLELAGRPAKLRSAQALSNLSFMGSFRSGDAALTFQKNCPKLPAGLRPGPFPGSEACVSASSRTNARSMSLPTVSTTR